MEGKELKNKYGTGLYGYGLCPLKTNKRILKTTWKGKTRQTMKRSPDDSKHKHTET